jgi:hypothetical protein
MMQDLNSESMKQDVQPFTGKRLSGLGKLRIPMLG